MISVTSAFGQSVIREIPFQKVDITDRFWKPRQDVNRSVTVPHLFDQLEKHDYYNNYALAAAGQRSGYKGYVFNDSDVYKSLEAASYALSAKHDSSLDALVDKVIAMIAKAQLPNGYINTAYQIQRPDRLFTNLRDDHELYCAGHMYEAAVAHFRATGKRNLLDIATKNADLMVRTFGKGAGQRMGYCGHPEVELALFKLSDATGDRKYRDLAEFFIESRGTKFFATEHNTPLERFEGEYWQDNCGIRDHSSIVGHAVRAAYLFSGVSDLARETRDQGLIDMLERVWRSTTEKRIFVTGGIGPSGSNEGFTVDYDLPTLTAYQETCASIAMTFWAHRMNLLHGDARYADTMETALYNGALAGISLKGDSFFYVNPLASRGTHHRQPWFGCACCPPNISRLLASVGSYAYAVSDDALWVNLYVNGSVTEKVGSSNVTLKTATDYPWSGAVKFTINFDKVSEWALKLRVPGWSSAPTVKVNGSVVAKPDMVKGYVLLKRQWSNEDVVTIEFPMPVRQIASHPAVRGLSGSYALARGPIVYALEQIDQKTPIERMAIPVGATIKPTKLNDILGGIVALDGEAISGGDSVWSGGLYQAVAPPQKVAFRAIPYYAWDNREPGRMEVWMPTTPTPPIYLGVEAGAKVGVSFRNSNSQPEGVMDGREPKDSGDQGGLTCHWWPHEGTTEWVEYTWEKPVKVDSSSIYWFDDTGRGACRIPASWRLLAWNGSEYVPVKLKSGKYANTKDAWVDVDFESIVTTKLRLEVQMQKGFASGVLRWRVGGDLKGGG